ncbi:MAG: hypothetical protein HFH93_01080 [Lachnospiraceae bacterium]|nr:hypothetical protein [Lachnospiraceae bacterium]
MKMKRKSRRRFWGRLTCLALASIMAAGCAMAALGGTARAAEPLDLARKCVLQVKVEPKAMEESGEAQSPDVAVDLYKVADAVKEEGFDACRFETTDTFAGLDVDIRAGETDAARIWMEQAGLAAAVVFAEGNFVAPAYTAVKAEGSDAVELTDLEPGLYLMVVRGADLEQADYLVRRPAEDGAEPDGIQTVAYSESYTFTYSPQLVALPTKESVDGTAATSNPGEWIYELRGMGAAESKPALSERFAALRIDKELTEYLTGNPATFVFAVEAVFGDRVVYSDVVSLTFTAPGIQSELIADKIPVGAQVTVTEIYSGATYQTAPDSAPAQTLTMTNGTLEDADFSNIASFRNIYNGTGRTGSAITNHFEYADDGEGLVWNWTQIPAGTPDVNE